MATFQYLGMSDEVSTCDCCGKANLKRTVAFDMDGETVYYGTTCATRNTGTKLEVWQTQAQKDKEARVKLAMVEYKQSDAYRAKVARFALRTAQRIQPGRGAADFVREACDAADAVAAIIGAKHGLERFRPL